MYAASRPGRRWRRFCPSWRPVAALRFRSVATWPPSCRVLPTFPSIVLLTLPLRRGLPGSSSTPLFLLHSQLVDISPFRQRRSPHTCSSFTPPLHHQIHPWNRWFPLTLTQHSLFRSAATPGHSGGRVLAATLEALERSEKGASFCPSCPLPRHPRKPCTRRGIDSGVRLKRGTSPPCGTLFRLCGFEPFAQADLRASRKPSAIY